MLKQKDLNKKIIIDPTRPLYKWSKGFRHIQQNFFNEDVKLRREKQIEDFIYLNEIKRVRLKIDTDILQNLPNVEIVKHSEQADLVIITDQKFSRYPCPVLLEKIQEQIKKCSNLYLCLNRRYINIDNSYHDDTLDGNFCLAVTQWLRKGLPGLEIIDMSLNVEDYGNQFTWAVPDRHYYIRNLRG